MNTSNKAGSALRATLQQDDAALTERLPVAAAAPVVNDPPDSGREAQAAAASVEPPLAERRKL